MGTTVNRARLLHRQLILHVVAGADQLQRYMETLLPGVFSALDGVCRQHGAVAGLGDAAAANVAKLRRRLETKRIHGDGSNRELTEAGVAAE